tara:strand:+ start:582 stop:1415 length:834 start_codon:yes stop_codon:yes gene_type:complete
VTDSKEISVGESLSLARKKKRLRYKKLSSELNIDPSYLIALEEENYSLIPGGDAYVKGFLRSYAKKLDLDPEKIVEDFNLSIKGNTKPKRWGLLKSERQQERFLGKKISIIFVVLSVLLILVALFVTFESNSSIKVQDKQDSIAIESAEETFSDGSKDLISEDLLDSKDLPKFTLEQDKVDFINLKDNKNTTLITVHDECWLEVFSENNRLLYKLATAGERFLFDEEVIMVIAGNFRNIDVLFNDKIVDLGPNANTANVSCVVLPAGDCSEFRTPNS